MVSTNLRIVSTPSVTTGPIVVSCPSSLAICSRGNAIDLASSSISSIQLTKKIDGSSAGYNIKSKPRISNNPHIARLPERSTQASAMPAKTNGQQKHTGKPARGDPIALHQEPPSLIRDQGMILLIEAEPEPRAGLELHRPPRL
jgi:hypothetical protein